MTLLSELSCPWEIDPEHCGLVDVDPTMFDNAVTVASAIMTRLSGFSVGLCEAELRPLSICYQCRTWCCGGTDSVPLSGPQGLHVWDVVQVRLGADAYDADTWYFDRDCKILYRVPPDRWPHRDEKWSAAGTGSAFVVDVEVGTPPDAWALDVGARLVKELVLSCTGGKCRLPNNVTTVTSQGITIRLRDNEINTLIPELAAWTHALNPFGAVLPGRVYSPEIRPMSCRG